MQNKNGTYSYQFAIVDKYGQPLTAVTSVSIYNAGTSTAATIYTDAEKVTTITNPILFAVMPAYGVINFTALAGSVDVHVTSTTGSCHKFGVTPSTARIEVEQENVPLNSIGVRTGVGSALTATTTETLLDSVTIPTNTLKVGDRFWVRSQGFCLSTNSTDTLTVKLYVGTEEIVTTGAVNIENSDVWVIDALITIRTIGSSATMVAAGFQILDAPGTAVVQFAKASGTEDLSAANFVISVKGTLSTTDAGNSVRSELFSCVRIPA